MNDWKIYEGDTVTVIQDASGRVLDGVVRYIPSVSDDVWIIENDYGIFYVQQYQAIVKRKQEATCQK